MRMTWIHSLMLCIMLLMNCLFAFEGVPQSSFIVIMHNNPGGGDIAGFATESPAAQGNFLNQPGFWRHAGFLERWGRAKTLDHQDGDFQTTGNPLKLGSALTPYE